MVRRVRQKQNRQTKQIHWRNVGLWLVVCSALMYAVYRAYHWLRNHPTVLWQAFWGLLVSVLIIGLVLAVYRYMRRHQLLRKYDGQTHKVNQLLEGMIWQGQTVTELMDSLGKPHQKKQQQLKTKYKEVWIYALKEDNTELSIVLENGVVATWERK